MAKSNVIPATYEAAVDDPVAWHKEADVIIFHMPNSAKKSIELIEVSDGFSDAITLYPTTTV